MDTDYAAPLEVDRVRARVSKVMDTDAGPEEIQTWVREFPLVAAEAEVGPGAYTLPATFGILPSDGDLDRDIVVELEAMARGSEQVLVSRRVKTGFVSGEIRLVRMHLYRACATLSCSTGETCGCADQASCSGPTCIDETVLPEDLEIVSNPGALPADAGIPLFDAGVTDSGVPPDDGGAEPDGSIPDGGEIHCEPPLTVCGLDCVNTEADPRYCGDCDTACSLEQVCDDGSCVDPGDCRSNGIGCSGFSYCDETTGDCLPGCADNAQCNGAHEICDSELHDCVCDTGFEDCSSGCVDTDIDPAFCGNCDTVCPTGQVCDLGICIDPGDCRSNGVGCSGFTYCDSISGDCLRGCADAAQCTAQNETCDTLTHECVCALGFHLCGAVCVSDLDVNSCGASCTPCPAPPSSTPTCSLGVCDFACAEDYERCEQACCLANCPAGQLLYNGICARVHVQTASAEGDLGELGSIALDPAGVPQITCYAASGRDLKFLAQQANASWILETPDGPDDVGRYASIAVDPSGLTHIAYYNSSDKNLMFATQRGADDWLVEVADDGGDDDDDDDGEAGEHTSLAFDATGTAHLSYYDKSNRDLMYATRPTGGAWTIERVDATSDVGQYTSLALGPGGTVHVSYYDASGKDLKYATRQANGTWVLHTVASDGNVGKYSALAFDASGVPHISFYGESARDLLYATELAHDSWVTTIIESAGDVGKEGSLAFGPDGAARVSYYDETAKDLKLAIQVPGESWAIETVDSAGEVGQHSSIAVDAQGNAHISYYDRSNKDIKYALIAAPE